MKSCLLNAFPYLMRIIAFVRHYKKAILSLRWNRLVWAFKVDPLNWKNQRSFFIASAQKAEATSSDLQNMSNGLLNTEIESYSRAQSMFSACMMYKSTNSFSGENHFNLDNLNSSNGFLCTRCTCKYFQMQMYHGVCATWWLK